MRIWRGAWRDGCMTKYYHLLYKMKHDARREEIKSDGKSLIELLKDNIKFVREYGVEEDHCIGKTVGQMLLEIERSKGADYLLDLYYYVTDYMAANCDFKEEDLQKLLNCTKELSEEEKQVARNRRRRILDYYIEELYKSERFLSDLERREVKGIMYAGIGDMGADSSRGMLAELLNSARNKYYGSPVFDKKKVKQIDKRVLKINLEFSDLFELALKESVKEGKNGGR